MAQDNKKTTVIAGKGYESIKTTEKYTPDTAPINYQEPPSSETEINEERNVPHIVLEPDKPKNELNISNRFLESFSRVYISGQYPTKGHTNLKIKAIILLIIQNNGLYHVRVNPSIKSTLLDILENGNDGVLGRHLSQFERNRIVAIYKHDNIL
jgi:hypothetical protein